MQTELKKEKYIQAFKKACQDSTELLNPAVISPRVYITKGNISIMMSIFGVEWSSKPRMAVVYNNNIKNFRNVSESIDLTEEEYKNIFSFFEESYQAITKKEKEDKEKLKILGHSIIQNYISDEHCES